MLAISQFSLTKIRVLDFFNIVNFNFRRSSLFIKLAPDVLLQTSDTLEADGAFARSWLNCGLIFSTESYERLCGSKSM